MKKPVKYSSESTAQVGEFLDNIEKAKINGGGKTDAVLDSIHNGSSIPVPKIVQDLFGKVGADNEGRVLDAVSKGIELFKAEHGTEPTADVVEAAFQQGTMAMNNLRGEGQYLDAVAMNGSTSNHSDPTSLQPNRAVVATLSAIAEANPWASYLPVDIGSNEAKLAILSHVAGSAYGDYTLGGLMDGVSAGDVYASASRLAKFDITGSAPFTAKISKTNLTGVDAGYCDPAGASVPVLRGRTIIYANGKVAAIDARTGNAGASPISGSVKLGNVDYAVAGSVTVATGALSITWTPTLPVGTEVTAEGFIDYEEAPALIPLVIVKSETYPLFANPWRIMTSSTIDMSSQLRNELGLDAQSEALMAIRTQMAMERHYKALRFAASLGKNNKVTYDFEWADRSQQMVRAQIWQDFQATLAEADQKMAEATMDHGITHIYVPAFIAGILQSLPSDMFVSSGIAARPSIYRVGRLFGKYEIYYSPKIVTYSSGTAKMVAIGRSTQVARCPVVLGDAVAPTFLDLNMQQDLKRNAAMYARDFTAVNPHEPSALGCAEITMSNLA